MLIELYFVCCDKNAISKHRCFKDLQILFFILALTNQPEQVSTNNFQQPSNNPSHRSTAKLTMHSGETVQV